MQLQTTYGIIDCDDLNLNSLSEKTKGFISSMRDASEIFFIDDSPTVIEKGVNEPEVQEVALSQFNRIGGRVEFPEKALAISAFTNSPLDDLVGDDIHGRLNSLSYAFDVGDRTYMVLTEEEANTISLEYAIEYINDNGFSSFGQSLRQTIIDNGLLNMTWFEDMYREDILTKLAELKKQSNPEEDTYINAFHAELVNEGVLQEPEWPEEETYLVSFNRAEKNKKYKSKPTSKKYTTVEEYKIALDEWKTESSELRVLYDAGIKLFQDEYDAYETELTDIINSFEDVYIDHEMDKMDPFEYFVNTYGEAELSNVIDVQDLLDIPATAAELVAQNGRVEFFPTYDGNEYNTTIMYQGKKYDFLIYKT